MTCISKMKYCVAQYGSEGVSSMEIRSVFQIAKREWENVSVSLESCGGIGEFDLVPYIETKPELIRNLIGMERKLCERDYLSREAAYVFTELGSEAALRLGLKGRLARAFGGGYGWVRTGWFDLAGVEFDHAEELEEHLTQEMFFFSLFFPRGGEYGWVFDSPIVSSRLKSVFDRFLSWQSDPSGYEKDVKPYRTRIDSLLSGLTQAFGAQSDRC